MIIQSINPEAFSLRLIASIGIVFAIIGYKVGKNALMRVREQDSLESDGRTLPYIGALTGFLAGSVYYYGAIAQAISVSSFIVYYIKSIGYFIGTILLLGILITGTIIFSVFLHETAAMGYNTLVSIKRDIKALFRTYM